MSRILTMVRFRRGSGWRAVRVGGVVLVLLCIWTTLSPTMTHTQHTRTNTQAGDGTVDSEGLGIPAPMTDVDAAIFLSRPHPLHQPAQVKRVSEDEGEGEGSNTNPRYNLQMAGPKLHRNQPFFHNKKLNIPEDYGEYGLGYEEVYEGGKAMDEEENVALEEEEEYKYYDEGKGYSDDKKDPKKDDDRNGNRKAGDREEEEEEEDDYDDDNAALEEEEYRYDEGQGDADAKINEKNNAAIEKGQNYEDKGADMKKDEDLDNVAVEEMDDAGGGHKDTDSPVLEDVGGVAMKQSDGQSERKKSQGKAKKVDGGKGDAGTRRDKATEKDGGNLREGVKAFENGIAKVEDMEGLDMQLKEKGAMDMKEKDLLKKKSLKFNLEPKEEQRGIKVNVGGADAARKRNQMQDLGAGKERQQGNIMGRKEDSIEVVDGNVNPGVVRNAKRSEIGKLNPKVMGISGKLEELSGGVAARDEGVGNQIEAEDTEAMKGVMAERKLRVQEVCGKYGLGPHATPRAKPTFKYPPTPTYEIFYIDRKDSLAWCPIYKVASTSWLYTFLELAGISESYVHNTRRQVSDVARGVWPPLEYYEAQQALNTCLKFMIVRHPFERLVSAFRDKLENTNIGKEHGVDHFYQKYGRKIVAKYRLGGVNAAPPANRYSQDMDDPTFPKPKGTEPTFPEFVRYLIDTDLLHYSDDHWMPYYLHCTPCLVDYDIIAKFETLDRDQSYVVQRAGLQGRVKPFWKHLTKGRKTADTVSKYFSTITKEELIKLYGKYRLDFELFDYSVDEYLDYVKTEEA